ncbi:glycosyltransferase family 4 protein [Cohaesibacter gelatinilyticus]|uniref:Glycosyl transferases group 1 n=1 Tax=Cohaesibacter gelatinilyticus TaxID=372072 RepID=A0A285NCB7_9HYPH|nr:glycosyltransferase family 4 protein [Cohaesibacter gelatinilyticus]SNZ07059.1 Glycosyl transferases group 1 [Cohaesibacter gelatinilyticus]
MMKTDHPIAAPTHANGHKPANEEVHSEQEKKILRVLVYSSERNGGNMPARQALYLAALTENPNIKLTILAPNGAALSQLAKEQELPLLPISEFGRSLLRRTPQLWPILTAMRRHSFDLAITHDGYAARGLSLIAKRVIGICHDDQFEPFKTVDTLLTLSSSAADKAKSVLDNDCDIQSLPYPYQCTSKVMKPEPEHQRLTVGASAHFIEKNGAAVFLHMAQLMVQERPDIRFILAGDGPDDQDLKQLGEQIAPFVEFPGRLTPAELAREIDVYCQTSRDEPFGLTLCAMMENGIACISTCTNGAMDILKGGMVAPLTPIDDALSLTERLLEMIGDPDRLSSVKKACFIRIREEDFDVHSFVDRLNEIVDKQAVHHAN